MLRETYETDCAHESMINGKASTYFCAYRPMSVANDNQVSGNSKKKKGGEKGCMADGSRTVVTASSSLSFTRSGLEFPLEIRSSTKLHAARLTIRDV